MAGDSKRRRLAEAESAFLRVIMSQELDEKANEHTLRRALQVAYWPKPAKHPRQSKQSATR